VLGVFVVGYPGYFVFDAVWPSFYYSPVADGKNAWLLGQTFFIAVYFVGAVMMFNVVSTAFPSSHTRVAEPHSGNRRILGERGGPNIPSVLSPRAVRHQPTVRSGVSTSHRLHRSVPDDAGISAIITCYRQNGTSELKTCRVN
jgi:hypothetical protein